MHVLDRLVYARAATPGPAGSQDAVVLWPDESGDDAGFGDRYDPVRVLAAGDGIDAAEVTAAVAGTRLLVGPWSGRLLLGPMLGVPTLALTTPASASPHLDLAYRAALALESPLLVVDRGEQLDLVAGLARRIAG